MRKYINRSKQTKFEVIVDEACRQWCDFIDEAPERRTGEGFAQFFYEILKDIYPELVDKYTVITQEKNAC